jgi:ligand-binding sensor domain-containing protein
MKPAFVITAAFLFFSWGHTYAQFSSYTPPATIEIRDIGVDDNNTILIATDKGVFELDGNKEWHFTTTADGLPSDDIFCIEALQGQPVYVGTANKGIAYRSGGTTWTGYSLKTAVEFEKVDAISILPGQDTIIGTDKGQFFYLSSKGIKAIPFSAALGNITAMGTIYPPGNPNIRYATSSNGNGLYIPDLDYYFNVNSSSSPLPSNNVLCSASENEFVYDGTDKGVYTVDFKNPQSPNVKVYKRGKSGLPSDTIQAVAVQDGVQWYGTPHGLARFDGVQWDVYTMQNSNLSSNNIVALAIEGDKIIAGTADGKINIAEMSTFGFTEIPGYFNFLLYPNPSKGTANITLPLKKTKPVNVTIYSLDGKKVIDAFEGNLSAGNNEISFDLSAVTPGTYLCGVKVGDYLLVKPMIIIH